jgi:hypothetical protein
VYGSAQEWIDQLHTIHDVKTNQTRAKRFMHFAVPRVATSLPLRYALAKTTQLMDQPMKL